MFSLSCFSEILILWMNKMWRRITNWPLILLKRNWAFLPSWQAKRWPRWGSLTSCPWWCTWPSSMRCSRTHSPPVVRTEGSGVGVLRVLCCCMACFLSLYPTWAPTKANLYLLCFYWPAIRVSPWDFAPFSTTHSYPNLSHYIYKYIKIIPIWNFFLDYYFFILFLSDPAF